LDREELSVERDGWAEEDDLRSDQGCFKRRMKTIQESSGEGEDAAAPLEKLLNSMARPPPMRDAERAVDS